MAEDSVEKEGSLDAHKSRAESRRWMAFATALEGDGRGTGEPKVVSAAE